MGYKVSISTKQTEEFVCSYDPNVININEEKDLTRYRNFGDISSLKIPVDAAKFVVRALSWEERQMVLNKIGHDFSEEAVVQLWNRKQIEYFQGLENEIDLRIKEAGATSEIAKQKIREEVFKQQSLSETLAQLYSPLSDHEKELLRRNAERTFLRNLVLFRLGVVEIKVGKESIGPDEFLKSDTSDELKTNTMNEIATHVWRFSTLGESQKKS